MKTVSKAVEEVGGVNTTPEQLPYGGKDKQTRFQKRGVHIGQSAVLGSDSTSGGGGHGPPSFSSSRTQMMFTIRRGGAKRGFGL